MLTIAWFSMIKIYNQRRFEVNMDRFADALGLDVATVVKKLAFDIFRDVVSGTPVKTGRAMNNWVIAIGTPDRSIIEDGGTGSKAGIVAGKKAEAIGTLAGLRPWDTVWISNNLPYIASLEEGTSKQAPNGWVSIAIQNNLRQLARFAL